VELTRADERSQIILRSNRMQAELLVGATGWPFEILFVSLAPGTASAPEPAAHDAKEAIVILSGRAKFESGSRVEHLLVGDSVAYDSRVPHRVTNEGDEELTFIDVIAGRF
jgi:mannose-6-phosphate isomerase-like protein (cupin superfamily)